MADRQQTQTVGTSQAQQDEAVTDAGVTYGREDRSWVDAAPENPMERLDDDVVIGLSEGELGAAVLRALRMDPMLDARRLHVVAVGDGTVILSGTVRDASDRALAGLIARRQPGVSRIENRLEIEKAIHEGSIWPHGVDHVETTSERFQALRKSQ